jgi:pyruvate dehydrogenase E1 component
MLHRGEPPPKSYVAECLGASVRRSLRQPDYIKLNADQIRSYVPGPYRVLGTDGFGRSDTRQKLRWFFEVDRHFVTIAHSVRLRTSRSSRAASYPMQSPNWHDPEKPNPRLV